VPRLSRHFFVRPTLTVTRELLGKYLVHQTRQGLFVGEINEVEAYANVDDPASHAFRGRTLRNTPMFLEGGHAYIYFTYGMHYCLNIVTEQADTAGAVLIRSVIPIEGIKMMQKNRGGKPLKILTNGPGKVCQAFGLTKQQNGLDLVTSTELWLEDRGKKISRFQKTPRIGIRNGTNKLWRFVS